MFGRFGKGRPCGVFGKYGKDLGVLVGLAKGDLVGCLVGMAKVSGFRYCKGVVLGFW